MSSKLMRMAREKRAMKQQLHSSKKSKLRLMLLKTASKIPDYTEHKIYDDGYNP